MGNIFAELEDERQRQLKAVNDMEKGAAQKPTRKSTSAREGSREVIREKPRDISPELPNREEIQEFSFRLRDELKTKVQAEVPHQWQKELAEIAQNLDVKKLELYRFILGEFLGKVRRKK